MSHHHNVQPETHGAHAPQVAVRDGNRLLCPCCGEVLMVLSEEASEAPADQDQAATAELPYDPISKKLYSPWDAIVARQDAAKAAAWQAYDEAQREKQQQRYAEYLESDDPGFCADYLTVPIDPQVAAYEFPDEDPPQLPAKKRTPSSRASGGSRSRRHEKRWRDVPLNEPYSYQEKRYLAWTYYWLKLQDLELQEKIRVKQAKIVALRREQGIAGEVASYEAYLPSEELPQVQPHVEVVEFDLLDWLQRVPPPTIVIQPSTRIHFPHSAKEREPPS
ncbi:hypothetical protein AB1K70_11380 [Bremerella sp. JC770]|uniref:hypothetical protein n=1 Tax=Bremerella sp. JC770 TaxID=3232137 RepID=UPI003457BE31